MGPSGEVATQFECGFAGREYGRLSRAWPSFLSVAIDALTHPVETPEDEKEDYEGAAAEVDRLLDEELGWNTDAGSPGATT